MLTFFLNDYWWERHEYGSQTSMKASGLQSENSLVHVAKIDV